MKVRTVKVLSRGKMQNRYFIELAQFIETLHFVARRAMRGRPVRLASRSSDGLFSRKPQGPMYPPIQAIQTKKDRLVAI